MTPTHDLRLLILTHLRAGLERRDWQVVERAVRLSCGADAATLADAVKRRSWAAVAAVYSGLGGVGFGERSA